MNLRLTATAGTPGTAGLIMNANVGGTLAVVVWWDANTVRLFRYSGRHSHPARPGRTLRRAQHDGRHGAAVATYAAGTYKVSFGGTNLINYTLSAVDQTTFGTNTYFGVVFQQ